MLEAVSAQFRAAAEAFVPEVRRLDEGEYARLVRIVEGALADRPPGVGVEHLSLDEDAQVPGILERAEEILADGRPALVEVAVDYSYRTCLTRGAVKTNFRRLPWKDRLRIVNRELARRLTG